MEELIKIDSTPARMAVNFDELKSALENELQKYDVVVTVDTLADAKKLATDINKTKAEIARRRKDEVAKASEPVRAFDGQMKELEALCEDGRQKILSQVQKFEDETRALVTDLLEQLRDKLWQQHGIEPEFRNANYGGLVKLTAITKTSKLTAGARNELETRVLADKALQDRTRMRLLELENQSYKAGLSSPLTRDHVAGFLFAGDEQYQAELTRIMEAEKRREEEAQRIIRERMEREQREKEERERREKAEQERVTAIQQNNEQPKPEQPAATMTATEAAVRQEEPQNQSEKQEPHRSAPTNGNVRIMVTATFSTEIPHHISDEEVERELRKVMTRAGITTLETVNISRNKNEEVA